MGTPWFSLPYSRPLSLEAYSILRTLNSRAQTGGAAGIEKTTLLEISNLRLEKFESCLEELKFNFYIKEKKNIVSITGWGTRRCNPSAQKLTTSILPRGPSNMA